jgi:hypothetical protein
MLSSRYPIALYWGPELALLYNERLEPDPAGQASVGAGPPGTRSLAGGPLFDNAITTAEGVWQEDELLPMKRRGYLEECYDNFTFSPIRGESSSIDGIFNAVVETTDHLMPGIKWYGPGPDRAFGASGSASSAGLRLCGIRRNRYQHPFRSDELADRVAGVRKSNDLAHRGP